MPEETTLETPPETEEIPAGETKEETAEEREAEAPETSEVEKKTETTEIKTVSYEEYEKLQKEHEKLQGRTAYAERELRRRDRERPAETKEAKPTPETGSTPPKPRPDDYDDYNDYVDALTDWKTDRKFEEQESRNLKKTAEEQRRKKQEKIDNVVSVEVAKDPDFLKKAYIPVALEDLVADSDQFAEIALYFGQNPQYAQSLVYMSPLQAAREIGKLESQLENKKPPQRTVTKAPEPTKTVAGTETVDVKLESLPTDEYIKRREKEVYGR